jgi:hypothetical protein
LLAGIYGRCLGAGEEKCSGESGPGRATHDCAGLVHLSLKLHV